MVSLFLSVLCNELQCETQHTYFSTLFFTEIQQSSYLQKHLVNTEQNIVPTYSLHSIPLDSHFQGINVQTQKGLIDGSILSYKSPQGTFKYLPDQYMVQQQLQHQQSISGKSPNSDSALQLRSLQSPSSSMERNPATNLISEPSVHIMTPSQSFLRVNNMLPQQSPQRPYQYSSDQHHSHGQFVNLNAVFICSRGGQYCNWISHLLDELTTSQIIHA